MIILLFDYCPKCSFLLGAAIVVYNPIQPKSVLFFHQLVLKFLS